MGQRPFDVQVCTPPHTRFTWTCLIKQTFIRFINLTFILAYKSILSQSLYALLGQAKKLLF
jgi:hypothetical protein